MTAVKTILVVDDEPEILNFVATALRRSGFAVLRAQSGEAALEQFDRSEVPIDLLLTDVVMPGMSGPMLVDRLLSLQPNLPVLFMSGYDDRQVVQRYVLKEGFALLPKPFDITALHAKIRDLLPTPPVDGRHSG